jgi:hypothetical protein
MKSGVLDRPVETGGSLAREASWQLCFDHLQQEAERAMAKLLRRPDLEAEEVVCSGVFNEVELVKAVKALIESKGFGYKTDDETATPWHSCHPCQPTTGHLNRTIITISRK